MKNLLLCMLFLFMGTTAALAQKAVSGNVSGSDGIPLIGVTVSEKGTTNGAITDLDGNYTIQVAGSDATLEISYTGYATQTIDVGDQATIDVVLEQGVTLDDVVVTALGIEREKKALPYSVTEIGAENFAKAREINVVNSLAGKVAGVNVSGTATGAGGSTRVVIRGNGSLSGNNQPLYVVDGVPIDNTNLGSAGMWGGQDWGDGISSLNPDDIETVTVLKGNTASALYGFRAANGVILITTKSGARRDGIGVEYNTQVRMESINNLLEFQDQYGHGRNGAKPTNRDEAFAQGLFAWGDQLDGSNVIQFDGQSRPYSSVGNNLDRFYRTGVTFSNTLALTGGNENYNFRFSAAALNNEDVVPNSGLDRNTFTLSTNAKFNDKLSARVSGTYVNEKVQNRPRLSDSPGNGNYTAGSLPPSINIDDLKGPTGKLGANEDGTELQFNDNVFVTNPWWATHQFEANSRKNRLIGNVQLRYDIVDGLYARGRIGLDRFNARRRNLTPYGTAFSNFGQLDEQVVEFQEINRELILGYQKDLSDFIGINLVVGGNELENRRETLGGQGDNFSVPFLHTLNNLANRSTIYEYREFHVNSLFGSAEIALNNSVYLTGTIRNDWFSTLTSPSGDSDNNILYYSGGVSAVLSDMVEMPEFITFAKVRASYAEVGGVGAAEEPYLLDLNYGIFAQGHLGNPLGGVNNTSIPNANLMPLTSREIEIGIDARFLNNRIGVDLALYNRKTIDDILSASVTPTSGYVSKVVNIGEVENRGIEMLLSLNPVRTENFRWDFTFNFAYNDNEVVRLLTETQDDMENLRLGESRTRNAFIDHIEGMPASQIMGFQYARDDSGNIMLDDGGLPMQGDFVALGTGVHPTSMGIGNTFTYKDFSLSFLIDARMGGHLYAATNAYGYFRGLHQNTLVGRETGIGNIAAENVEDYYQSIAFSITEEFVQEADFAKLREVVFSYRLPRNLVEKTPFQSVNVGFAGRNLALLASKIDNVDPESTYTNANGQGLEMFGVPATRSFQFNIGVKF
ncbi:MAG: SusC/RagA family TonB-linked outer membrane protein [Bacteroidota bacterium]